MSVTLLDHKANGVRIESHRPSGAHSPGIKPDFQHSINGYVGDAVGGGVPQVNGHRPSQLMSGTKRLQHPQDMQCPRRPTFDELPFRSHDDPKASAWALYGADDELGTLNLQTPEVVSAALSEPRLGVMIPLKYV